MMTELVSSVDPGSMATTAALRNWKARRYSPADEAAAAENLKLLQNLGSGAPKICG
jgi:hypothetical protein